MIAATRRTAFFLLALALLSPAAHVAAQDREAGVKAGLSLATVDTEGNGRFDRRADLVVGAFTAMRLFGLDLQPEVLYVVKGASVSQFDITSELKLEYLEFPVLVRLTRSIGDARRVYAAGGPAFAVRLRATTRTEFDDAAEEISITDEVEPFDIGVAVGGGIEWGRLVFDGRYTHGLLDVDKDTAAGTRNRVITVTAGYRF